MLLYFFYVAVVDFFNFFNMFFFSLLQSQIRDVVTRPPGCCNSRIYMFFLLLQLSIRDVATCPRGCCNYRFPMCGVPPRTPRQWRRIAVSSSPAPDMHAGTHRGGGAALLLQGAAFAFCRGVGTCWEGGCPMNLVPTDIRAPALSIQLLSRRPRERPALGYVPKLP